MVSALLLALAAVFTNYHVQHLHRCLLVPSNGQRHGVHDHGSIVWDEFVGMWITLMAIPDEQWQWVLTGFVVFRVLDIFKPWPIR